MLKWVLWSLWFRKLWHFFSCTSTGLGDDLRSEAGPPSAIESVDGDPSEVDVRVEAVTDIEEFSEPEVVPESEQPSERRSESPEVQITEVEADAVSDNELPTSVEVKAEVEETSHISESEPVNEINEESQPSSLWLWAIPDPPAISTTDATDATVVTKPEPKPRHPEVDPDPEQTVESVVDTDTQPEQTDVEVQPEFSPVENQPVEPEDPRVDSPEPDDPGDATEGGYTSASHSYHPSDSEDSDSDGEVTEALQAELASKEDEHSKLAAQLQLMQQEMEALRKMLEQNQQELATSSKETRAVSVALSTRNHCMSMHHYPEPSHFGICLKPQGYSACRLGHHQYQYVVMLYIHVY